MAYDEYTADRIRQTLSAKKVPFEERKMFGGLCFMVDDKMCIGVHTEKIMARVDPEREEELLLKPGAKTMDFTGRPMKGFIFVEPNGYDLDEDLKSWVDQCLEYNPKARSSKRKK